mgnify:CR=1 FL=1
MSGLDIVFMSLRNLWKRKLRTFLTVLGVIIGTASIVVMISIGIGMNESFKNQLSEIGSLQTITVNAPYDTGVTEPGKTVLKLDDNAIQSFKEIPGVEVATPQITSYMIIACGRYVADCQFVGLDPAAMEALGYTATEGRLLNTEDKGAIVIGQDVIDQFYNPKISWRMRYSGNAKPVEVDVFNDKLQVTYDWSYGTNNADKGIKPTKVKCVGVLASGGSNGYSVVMPIKDLQKIVQDQQKYYNRGTTSRNNQKKATYDQALVKVTDLDRVQEVQEQIKAMGFETYSLSDALNSMQETSKMLQMVLGAIGAISLVVAAIGITNTMVMSIYERTREIGIMKVIGATLRDIRWLFLTEAAFIGCFGGLLGILLSYIASKLVNVLGVNIGGSELLSVIPVWLMLAALGFSTLVGILAGYLPAQRAMKLSALSAIKSE